MSDKEAVPEWNDLMTRRGRLVLSDSVMPVFWREIQTNHQWQIIMFGVARRWDSSRYVIEGCSWLFEPLDNGATMPEYMLEVSEDDNGKVTAVNAVPVPLGQSVHASWYKHCGDPLPPKAEAQASQPTLDEFVESNPDAAHRVELFKSLPPEKQNELLGYVLDFENGAQKIAEFWAKHDPQDDKWSRAADKWSDGWSQDESETARLFIQSRQAGKLAKQRLMAEALLKTPKLNPVYMPGSDYYDSAALAWGPATYSEESKPDPKIESFAEALAAANRKVGC